MHVYMCVQMLVWALLRCPELALTFVILRNHPGSVRGTMWSAGDGSRCSPSGAPECMGPPRVTVCQDATLEAPVPPPYSGVPALFQVNHPRALTSGADIFKAWSQK